MIMMMMMMMMMMMKHKEITAKCENHNKHKYTVEKCGVS